MPAVKFLQPSLPEPANACETCGACSIDLWMSITSENYICKNCLRDDRRSHQDLLLCPGSRFGCKYQTGIVGNCLDHLRTCPRRPTGCPNECSFVVANVDLPKHMLEDCPKRTQECRFCHVYYFISDIKDHFKECQEYPVTCRYCNQEGIRRGSLEEHGAGCRKTPKSCQLAALGCAFMAGDDEMSCHMTLEKHAFCMHELKVQVNSLEAEVRQLREQVNREKQERQKVEELLQKERQVRDEDVKKLRGDVEVLRSQFGPSCNGLA